MRTMAGLAVAALALGGCSLLGPDIAEVGQCVDLDSEATEITELKGFDCATEHDAEVYLKADVTYDGDYDYAAIDDEAVSMCLDAFQEYVGADLFATELDIYYVYPLEEGWSAGDREVVCAVYTPDPETGEVVRTSGSLKNSEA